MLVCTCVMVLLCCQATEELIAEREKNEQNLADKIQLTEVRINIHIYSLFVCIHKVHILFQTFSGGSWAKAGSECRD